jgi:hypothetical protein
VFDELLRISQDPAADADAQLEARVEKRLGQMVGLNLKLWQQGGFMHLMPYTVKIH